MSNSHDVIDRLRQGESERQIARGLCLPWHNVHCGFTNAISSEEGPRTIMPSFADLWGDHFLIPWCIQTLGST